MSTATQSREAIERAERAEAELKQLRDAIDRYRDWMSHEIAALQKRIREGAKAKVPLPLALHRRKAFDDARRQLDTATGGATP